MIFRLCRSVDCTEPYSLLHQNDNTQGMIRRFSDLIFQEERPSCPPRLFQCSNASGAFKVDEIFEFSQEVINITF